MQRREQAQPRWNWDRETAKLTDVVFQKFSSTTKVKLYRSNNYPPVVVGRTKTKNDDSLTAFLFGFQARLSLTVLILMAESTKKRRGGQIERKDLDGERGNRHFGSLMLPDSQLSIWLAEILSLSLSLSLSLVIQSVRTFQLWECQIEEEGKGRGVRLEESSFNSNSKISLLYLDSQGEGREKNRSSSSSIVLIEMKVPLGQKNEKF